jgi:hypothetical protein
MNPSSRVIFVVGVFFLSCSAAKASPDYTFEGLLPRAENVFIGRVTSHSEQDVTLEVTENLRGGSAQRALTFRYSGYDDRRLSGVNDPFLVISQGDNHFGKPQSQISLGQYPKGQAGYCGWIAFPLRTDQGVVFLDLIRTLADQKEGATRVRLTLAKARTLIGQIPYRPNLNGNGAQQGVGPESRQVGRACFASNLVRRRLREIAPPGQR